MTAAIPPLKQRGKESPSTSLFSEEEKSLFMTLLFDENLEQLMQEMEDPTRGDDRDHHQFTYDEADIQPLCTPSYGTQHNSNTTLVPSFSQDCSEVLLPWNAANFAEPWAFESNGPFEYNHDDLVKAESEEENVNSHGNSLGMTLRKRKMEVIKHEEVVVPMPNDYSFVKSPKRVKHVAMESREHDLKHLIKETIDEVIPPTVFECATVQCTGDKKPMTVEWLVEWISQQALHSSMQTFHPGTLNTIVRNCLTKLSELAIVRKPDRVGNMQNLLVLIQRTILQEECVHGFLATQVDEREAGSRQQWAWKLLSSLVVVAFWLFGHRLLLKMKHVLNGKKQNVLFFEYEDTNQSTAMTWQRTSNYGGSFCELLRKLYPDLECRWKQTIRKKH